MQVVVLLVIVVRLLPGRHRGPPVAPALRIISTDRVTIVVPCFNEARRISPCIDGVLAQSAQVHEIAFVDSGSTDGTLELLSSAARTDGRVKILHDPPLPQGWVGKVWALQHALSHTTGDWVLGIDADTQPNPGMATGALNAAIDGGYDVVSFAPRFQIATVGERWLQPALLVTLVYRFGAAGTEVSPQRVMANGQCFLAKRSALLAEDGYAAAKSSFSDDVTLARHFATRGYRVGFLDGSRLYDVRSYSSAMHTWREWGRSLDLKDSSTVARQWADVMLLVIAQGTPLAGLVWGYAATPRSLALMTTSSALLAIRIALLFAMSPSYAQRGVAFYLSVLADPLAALRILISSARRPRSWRGRAFVPQDAIPERA